MRLAPECGACAAIQLTRTLSFRTNEWRRHFPPAMSAALAAYADADNPGQVLAALYEAVQTALDDGDPYQAAKDAANRWAEAWWASHGVPLEDLPTRLLLAAQANAIDAGVDTAVQTVVAHFDAIADDAPGHDDRTEFAAWLATHPSPRILYFLDNCGEAVLDRELIRALSARGAAVTVVVRGSPVLNDVTEREAAALGLHDLAAVVSTDSPRYGLSDADVAWLTRHIESTDLVIAKGIANLEALSHRPTPVPALFLYRAKCPPSARLVGAPRETAVIWWRQGGLGEP
jgi:uncharacterized protein with ATP-grasp and redox domains